MYFSTLSIVCG